MTNPSQIEIEAYERDVTAALNREVAAMAAQSADLDQRMLWFASMGQLPPPQLFLDYGNGLRQWIEYLRAQYGPAAEWLMKQQLPAVKQGLEAIIADLSQAAPRYDAMAGQTSRSQMGMFRAEIATNREINDLWGKTNANNRSSNDALSAKRRNVL